MAALVHKVHKGQSRERLGRGFSLFEIKTAGLSAGQARKMAIPVDSRRKSRYDANVDLLRKIVAPSKDVAHRIADKENADE